MSFLKAEWRKLAIANYEVNPNVLQDYVPFGTELDLWEGKCYVSLVGFRFINTKLLGLKIPFHVNFEEVNLRFYVRRFEAGEWRRGVVFIKEIVPKRAITFVANSVYKENYETMSMQHTWKSNDKQQLVEYRWLKSGKWNSFRIESGCKELEIESGSITEFITEHYWGFAKVNHQKSNAYEVTHPRWLTYEVHTAKIDVDFGEVYGKEFSFLSGQEPNSIMLAEGSEITVEGKQIIR
jgi:uncharacterized protein